LIEIRADFGEVGDRWHCLRHFVHANPHQLTGDEDVLAPGEFRVKANTQFQDRGNASAALKRAFGRPGDPRRQLEQRALAGTVLADDRHGLSARDRHVDIAQHPDLLVTRPPAQQRFLQSIAWMRVPSIRFADVR